MKKLSNISESIWGKVLDRGAGETVRKEDDVNNMTIEDIDRLIRIFIDRWIALGRPETRFSLRALSGDFGRLRSVVENLSDRYHVYVP